MMKKIINIAAIALLFIMSSCESSEDISIAKDHQVPECKSLKLTVGGQSTTIADNITTQYLWGVMPQTNLETIVLPTASVTRGSTFNISVVLSDNTKLKSAVLVYSPWLYSKYINFSNPEGDIPLNPATYTLSADVAVPPDAVATPWLENYYFKDGFSMKITQSYHKMELTVTDVNMNKRTISVYVKVL